MKKLVIVLPIVCCLLVVGIMVFQTTQHRHYLQKAIDDYSSIEGFDVQLVECETGLFTTEAVTSVNIEGHSLLIRHILKSGPLGTTAKSTVDVNDGLTSDTVNKIGIKGIDTAVVTTKLGLFGVDSVFSAPKIVLPDGDADLTLSLPLCQISIGKSGKIAVQASFTQMSLDIHGTEALKITGFTLDADDLSLRNPYDYSITFRTDSIVMITAERSKVSAQGLSFFTASASRPYKGTAKFDVGKITIGGSVVEAFCAEISLRGLNVDGLEELLEWQREIKDGDANNDRVKAELGSLVLKTIKPSTTFGIDQVKGLINKKEFRFSSNFVVGDLNTVAQSQFQDVSGLGVGKAELFLSEGFPTGLTALSNDVRSIIGETTSMNSSPSQKLARLKKLISPPFFSITEEGYTSRAKFENGHLSINGILLF